MTPTLPGNPTPEPTPPSWHFAKVLIRVRNCRRITIEEACAWLPGVSPRRFEAWEQGLHAPPSWIQTMVVWRLNTASKRVFIQANANGRQGFVASGVLTGAFSVAVLLVTLVCMHFVRERHAYIDPAILAKTISADAIAHGLTEATAEDYMDYASDLSDTISQFTRSQWDVIVGTEEEN